MLQPNARDGVQFIILATSIQEAQEFLDAAINRRTHPQVHVVTSTEELRTIASLPVNKVTPWYYLQGSAHNRGHRDAYYHLEQRFGAVWGGPAFVQSLADHLR